MQVSIKNFPPLITHLSFLFLGFFLTNLSAQPEAYINIEKHKVLVSLSKNKAANLKVGSYVYVAKQTDNNKSLYCFISASKSQVIQNNHKPILSCSYTGAEFYLQAANTKNYVVINEKQAKKELTPCFDNTNISYGTKDFVY